MIQLAHSKMAGRYKLKVLRSDGSVRLETDWFDNLITNNGLDQIMNVPGGVYGIAYLFVNCFVGTGSATPLFTDGSLQAYLATASANSSTSLIYVAGPPPFWYVQYYYRFAVGTATGNLSEIGIGHTPTNMFSRALIVDGGGSPTTITVLADELLDVTYEFRVYPPTADSTFAFVLNGVSQSVTSRSYDITSAPLISYGINGYGGNPSLGSCSNTALVALTADLSGQVEVPGTLASYTIGNYYVDVAFTYSLYLAVRSTYVFALKWRHGKMQFLLTNPAVKSNAQTMDITARISWGRYP